MTNPVLWVEDDDTLRRVLGEVAAGPVAVDTEADSFHHYREKVCLLQMSSSAGDVLVDPLAGVDLRLFQPIFADRSIVKVLHGADYDLRILRRDFDLEVRGLFDTMIAARLVGERAYGLAALLERFLGVRIDKAHQRDDWSERPLPPSMIAYASTDTRHLIELHGVLSGKLQELDRTSWAEEEFLRLEAVRFQPDERDGEEYRDVKGASSLDRRGLAVLRELSLWRHAVAAHRDVPLFRVLRDEVLVALSKGRPGDGAGLRSIAGVPRSLEPSRERALLAAIAKGEQVGDPDLPTLDPKPKFRRDPALEARVKVLRDKRDGIASDLGIDPSVLATRSVLEEVLGCLDRGHPIGQANGIRQWQARILAGIL